MRGPKSIVAMTRPTGWFASSVGRSHVAPVALEPLARSAPDGAACAAIGGRPSPAKHGARAGQQLMQAERLGHVIVGAQLEPDHAVHLVPSGAGGDDDRDF